MYTLSEEVWIAVEPDVVFASLERPETHVRVTPNLEALTRGDAGGHGTGPIEYVFVMAGVRLEGTIRNVERKSPRRLVYELTGGIAGTVRHRLDPEDGGTRVAYDVTYRLPECVLEAVSEQALVRYNEQEIETALENLKTRLESPGSPEE